MNIELSIIKSFIKDKDIYNKYIKYIDRIFINKDIKYLLNTIIKYYTKYTEHNYISLDEFKSYFYHLYPTIKDKTYYNSIFTQLGELDTSDSFADELVKSLIEKSFVQQIVDLSLPVLSNEKFDVMPKLEETIKEFYNAIDIQTEEETVIYTEEEIQELFGEEIHSTGYKWRLECLNNDIGSLSGSTLGHVFARPNCGKTSFLLSEAAYFATQLDDGECILYINNEDAKKRIKRRLMSAVCGATAEQIYLNIPKALQLYQERGGEKIILIDQAIMTMDEVAGLIKKHKPQLVVIDQGDKITFRGGNSMANHDRLKEIYRQFRELAKTYDTNILTAGQASMDAHNKKWLNQLHMDNSKTGKPGELDYAIGIGKQEQEFDTMVRYITIVRNKLKNGEEGRHTVTLSGAKARYQDA